MASQNLRLPLITLCLTVFIVSVRSRHVPGVHKQLESNKGVAHPARLLTGAINPDLKKICDNTDHPELCLSNLGPLVKGKPTVDSALDASFLAGANFAKEALAQVKTAATKSNPRERMTYSDCTNFYQTAVDNFGKSAAAKSEKDVDTVETDLSAIITVLETCEDEFSDFGSSPFTGLAEKLEQMTSNSLAIAQQLH